MEHIKTLNTKNLQNTVKKGGCGGRGVRRDRGVNLAVDGGKGAGDAEDVRGVPVGDERVAGDDRRHVGR